VFIGRRHQLDKLQSLLHSVVTATSDRPGKALLIRGRRRVGKSRLVEEFADRAGVPVVFFTASTQSPREELTLFCAEVAESGHPAASRFIDVQPRSWDAALRLLADHAPQSGSIVVIDELPYLIADDPSFEGMLQKVFDRELSKRRVLLIGIGSDLSMVEALNAYGRPLHQRAAEMVVPPLSPAETARMLGLDAADAFDGYLVTGGLPMICGEWPSGQPLRDYLRAAVTDPTSALVVSGERAVAAEFPAEAQARTVLNAIGAGERTFTTIGRAAGLPAASLSRALNVLVDKRVVAADLPLSTMPSKEKRYRVADPHLRFWLTFIGPHLPEIERGRGDRVLDRIERSWTSWRGRAIGPLVRESLERMPEYGAAFVGGYWTRTNDPEIDVVVADKPTAASRIHAVGSIKWLEQRPFDEHDFADLVSQRQRLPGTDRGTTLLVVSRSGATVQGVRTVSPAELLGA
jgi:AAA+ ATPase superfamily predicted ATPase